MSAEDAASESVYRRLRALETAWVEAAAERDKIEANMRAYEREMVALANEIRS